MLGGVSSLFLDCEEAKPAHGQVRNLGGDAPVQLGLARVFRFRQDVAVAQGFSLMK